MKISFYIAVATSALSLVLAVIVLFVGYGNQGLQTEIQGQQKEVQKQQQELQKQQQIIDTAVQIQKQVGPALLQDMAVVSLKNTPMKELLSKHGYNVQPPASPAPGGGGASAPTPPPSAPSEPALR
jgi:hypothetical protein